MIINNDIEFDLEDFLNEELEHSKMTPSASVWANIRKEVQPKYRWSIWILTLLMLFIPYSLVMYYLPTKTSTPLAAINSSNNTYSDIANKSLYGLKNIQTDDTKLLIGSVLNKPVINYIADNNKELTNDNQDGINLNNAIAEKKLSSKYLHSENTEKKLLLIPAVENMVLTKLPAKITKQPVANKSIVQNIVKNEISSKLAIEVYATPSVSYRTMSDDKTRLEYYRNIYRNNPFTDNISSKNVNTVVNERSSMGREIGIGTRYAIASRWKLKAGIQINVRQFTAEAYKATGMANFAFVKNNLLDSVSENAQYATAGTDKVTLTNSIYTLSVPIGVQWDCIKKNKFSVGIGASLQPTYLLQDNSYILSTDYTYFSKGSKFTRQWNLNSAVDVSLNYTNKQCTFYIAPQFRYQLLTTYQDLYSIKEHRWDLGLKVGVLKTF